MYNDKFHTPEDFAEIINKAAKDLKKVKFDIIVFRGFSGAIVGSALALQLRKPWALVRKPGDSTHSGRLVEGDVEGDYIIVDDFIDSGVTVNEIIDVCRKGNCIGVYLYDRKWLRDWNDEESRSRILHKIGVKVINWESA